MGSAALRGQHPTPRQERWTISRRHRGGVEAESCRMHELCFGERALRNNSPDFGRDTAPQAPLSPTLTFGATLSCIASHRHGCLARMERKLRPPPRDNVYPKLSFDALFVGDAPRLSVLDRDQPRSASTPTSPQRQPRLNNQASLSCTAKRVRTNALDESSWSYHACHTSCSPGLEDAEPSASTAPTPSTTCATPDWPQELESLSSPSCGKARHAPRGGAML